MKTDTAIAILGILAMLAVGAWSALGKRFSGRRPPPNVRPRDWVHNATQHDVERIVRRDFPAEQFPEVIAVLREFNNQWESTVVRVRLATLKLADGNVDELKKYLAVAKEDYWDVISWAEYCPLGAELSRAVMNIRKQRKTLSKKERQRIVDADWQQYEDWLRR